MFHDFPQIGSATSVVEPEPSTLRLFVQEHGESLANAATLLAGRRGANLTAQLMEALACRAATGRHTRKVACDLLDILTLEHVHNPDREEAARFAELHPSDPRVEDICLLADALRSAIEPAFVAHPAAPHHRPTA